MEFTLKNSIEKEAFGMKIIEYCNNNNNPFPIDCAVAKFRNSEYPCKINHGFYETFFILEGECIIKFEDRSIKLSKHDFFIIEPGKKHITRAKFADIIICCTPPFSAKNVEFCKMKASNE